MDLPCPGWIKHVEQIWSGLDPEQKSKFSAQSDIDEIFDCGWLQITPKDVAVLSRIGETCAVQKCAQTAAKLQEKGNGSFKVKDYTSAALYYSKGLCQAPADSEQLALCYANRSAALFHLTHYQECLEDISRALAHGYPSQLQPKLFSRRDQCQGFIRAQPCGQEKDTATPTIPQNPQKDQTPTPDHPHTHSITAGVSLRSSSEKGRHLVVVEGKSAGEVLLEDQAFSCVLIPGEGTMGGQEGGTRRGVADGAAGAFGTEDCCCHRCLCPTLCPVPCPGCSYTRYCGHQCQQQAWHEHHCWECLLGAELSAAGVLAQLALRVALKGGLQQVRRARGSEVTDTGQPKKEVSERVKKKAVRDDGKEKTCAHSTTAPPDGQTEPVLPSSASVQMTDLCVGCHGDAYQRVYSLLPHVEGHAPSLRFLYAVTIATLYQLLQQAGPPPSSWRGGDFVSDSSDGQLACEDSVGEAWTPELSILGATALRHLLQLRANAQAITAERVSDECGTAVQASREIRIATAIFPNLSLMNHACRPNTSVTFDPGYGRHSSDTSITGVSVTVLASRDLSPGEEILHCYGPHCSRMAVQQRQLLLLEQYLFTCQCEACLQDLQSPPEGATTSTHYKCPKCAKPLQRDPGVYVCVRKGCSGQVSSRDMTQTLEVLTALLDQAMELLEQDTPVEALRLLQEAQNRAKRHLLDTHQLHGQLCDATARAYASVGDWGSAASHLSGSVASVRCQFGPDSVEVGQQLFKLAQLHFNGGQAGQCVSVMGEARRVLSLHRNAHSQELQELRAMEDCLKGAL